MNNVPVVGDNSVIMHRPVFGFPLLGAVLSFLFMQGCGTSAPTDLVVAEIAAQTVLRNTVTPRSVEVSVEVESAFSSFSVMLNSDDASVVSDEFFACAENPCPISFTPSPNRSAEVTVTLSVAVDEATTGATQFSVSIVARLVRDRMDGDPAPVDSLRDVVGKAVEGDVIAFDTDGAFSQSRTITLERPIQLQKDVTIEGHGVDEIAVSGGTATGLFVVGNSSRVALRDMTLRDSMQTEPGGAVNVEASSELTVERCTLAENTGAQGVAIYGIDATVTLDAAKIANNMSSMGPAVFAQGGMLRVLNSTTFADNIGGDRGALAAIDGALVVEDSLFERNEQVNDAAGGAILVIGETASATIERTTFTENIAEGRGSAIAFFDGVLSVSESTFRGNAAGAGCLYVEGASVTVDGSMFDANTARVGGAAILASSTNLEVTGSIFQNNDISTNFSSGAINVLRGSDPRPFTLRTSRITGTTGFGAAVSVGRVVTTIEDVEISGTRSLFGGDNGGGLSFLPEDGSVVRRTRIVDNRIQDSGGRGGGINARRPFLIEDCEISDNFAQRGGGIFVSHSLVVRDTVISGNEAELSGGGLFVVEGVEVELEMGTRLVSNEATEGGGAYVDEGGLLRIDDSQVGDSDVGNMADFGGGVYARGSLILDDTTISNNIAAQRGGGIAVFSPMANTAEASLNDAVIRENSAGDYGGGLWLNGGSADGNDDLTITANRVNNGNGGGGIYVEGAGNVCRVPFDRVTDNWWGLLESNIVPPQLCL